MSARPRQLCATFNDRWVDIQCDSEALENPLRQRLRHLLTCSKPSTESLLRITLAELAPSCVELRDSTGRMAHGSIGYVLHLTRKWMTASFASAHPNHLWLHAAAATRNGFGVLLAGPAAAGKSTMAVRLIEHGWHLLADDAVALRTEDWTALPLPFTPDFRTAPHGVGDDRQALLEQTKVVATVRDGQVARAPASIEAIVFPVYDSARGDSPFLRRLPVVTAVQALAEQCSSQGPDRSEALRHVVRLVRHIPCHRLLYADAESAAGELTHRSASHFR